MIRERKGNFLTPNAIRVAHSIHTFMVVTDNVRDLRVVFDLGKNPFANY